MAFTLTPEREEAAKQLIKRYPVPRAACIPILHLCQQQEGWISPAAIALVAHMLEMTTAQVQGVVTFYTSFHQERVAPNVIWVCRTLSCDLRGAKVVQDHLEKKLGCTAGHTSTDGKFTLKKAECLAACGQAPMVQINDEFYENLTLEKLDRIIAEYARKTPAQTQNAAHVDASAED
jgi:NADH-quinone oxidoreductase subunit E